MMNFISNSKCLCRLSIFLLLLSCEVALGAEVEVQAITAPSKDVVLSFVNPGRISKVHVKRGDRVSKGEVVVEQERALEKARFAHLKAESEDKTEIEAARARFEQKEVDLKKLKWAHSRGSATELELEHARLDVTLADLSLKIAQLKHRLAVLKLREQEVMVEQRKLESPVSGRVEALEVEAGESVNALQEVVRVVNVAKLWIDVPVPLKADIPLRQGGSVKVRFPRTEGDPVEGKIIFVGTVANAASETLEVRVEVDNEFQRPAGEPVMVVF